MQGSSIVWQTTYSKGQRRRAHPTPQVNKQCAYSGCVTVHSWTHMPAAQHRQRRLLRFGSSYKQQQTAGALRACCSWLQHVCRMLPQWHLPAATWCTYMLLLPLLEGLYSASSVIFSCSPLTLMPPRLPTSTLPPRSSASASRELCTGQARPEPTGQHEHLLGRKHALEHVGQEGVYCKDGA